MLAGGAGTCRVHLLRAPDCCTHTGDDVDSLPLLATGKALLPAVAAPAAEVPIVRLSRAMLRATAAIASAVTCESLAVDISDNILAADDGRLQKAKQKKKKKKKKKKDSSTMMIKKKPTDCLQGELHYWDHNTVGMCARTYTLHKYTNDTFGCVLG